MYGEITAEGVGNLIMQLRLEHDLFAQTDREAVFYDLGAGIGKPCLLFALALPSYFSTCIGIELFDSLHHRSLDLKKVYEDQTNGQVVPRIDFVKGDFFKD